MLCRVSLVRLSRYSCLIVVVFHSNIVHALSLAAHVARSRDIATRYSCAVVVILIASHFGKVRVYFPISFSLRSFLCSLSANNNSTHTDVRFEALITCFNLFLFNPFPCTDTFFLSISIHMFSVDLSTIIVEFKQKSPMKIK